MPRLSLVSALCLVAAPVAAQSRWNPEIGLQGGYTYLKPSGTGVSDAADFLAVPGGAFFTGLLAHPAFFAVLPVGEKLALEPQFMMTQLTTIFSATTARLGLRADYAVGEKIYVAGGATLMWLEGAGDDVVQFGLQGAVGYRLRLGPTLGGRIEASYVTTEHDDNLAATNQYSVLFGLSTRLNGGATARSASTSSSRWRPVLGVSGGYFRTHFAGGGDLAGFTLPGFGSSGTIAFGPAIAAPPTMFAVFPVGQKFALEPGVDLQRSQGGGTTTFSGNFSVRIDYAVTGGWYLAAGPALNYVKTTGVDAGTISGATFAGGYRFPIGPWFSGRVETNYTTMGSESTLGVPAQSVFGISFGAMIPLR